jgi:hypothetical protein
MSNKQKQPNTQKQPMISNLLLNENLLNAELAVRRATRDNIVELCRKYLQILTEYRDQLQSLRGMPEINLQQPSTLARELIDQSRKAIRAAIEITVCERNQTEALLKSFTSISGYEAVETFNKLKYKGFDNWELRTGGIRLKNGVEDKPITVQEAVDIAGKLRRDAYVAHKITFLRK